ncbi:acyl-CoA thioesterase [Emcibacter nanhaiensis]|uniref:Thioesterase n=1 Tax=Emcibacter nanhaiensis TaxID=1505037 RepID=A0A501PPI4_9PROT|nr:thioesterase family protein [Emcibacter nanhaiensis]TPD61706.1 thioesterase [Emcibacter nanhaiensis]
MIETYRGIVYPTQLDHMGHMNVQWYTAKFDEATWHFVSALGLTQDYVQGSGMGMAALQNTTHYKAEVMVGRLLVIKSKLLEINNKTIKFLHVMYDAESGQEVATSELIGAHLDRTKRKAVPFPEEIAAKARAMLAAEQ